ncbi:hypothetical protein [Adlercreutzia equolifaciens]|uniref:hypothetical protein n=1 Tax=Adlercreutzia equolifaciens TaxID=446660 RepID=UPI003AEF8EB7
MEKLPPVEKVYEAWTALVDDRYDLSPEALIVRSSDGSKEYRVTWDDEGRYRSNDNATFWQGYAGYPVIMALMLQGRVPFNGEVPLGSRAFRGRRSTMPTSATTLPRWPRPSSARASTCLVSCKPRKPPLR